jgi:hypothetical protein
MRVVLKAQWFGPDHRLYERKVDGGEIPDEYRKLLPKSAVVSDDEKPAPVVEPAKAPTLADFDAEREAGEIADAKALTAEETLRINRARIKAQLAAEKADK